MPYVVRHDGEGDKSWCVYKRDGGAKMGCTSSRGKANAMIRAMYANEHKDMEVKETGFQQLLDQVRSAFSLAHPPKPTGDEWGSEAYLFLMDVFDDHVIVQCSVTRTYWQIGYKKTAEGYEFDTEDAWEEVELSYIPVSDIELEEKALPGEDALPPKEGALKALWKKVFGKTKNEVASESVFEFITREQPDGRSRWVSVSSTAFLDGHQEIVSKEAIDRGLARAEQLVKEGKDRGPLLFWHTPSVSLGTCDYQVRDGACLVESGLWDDTPAAKAAQRTIEAHPDVWGISIGFYGKASAPDEIKGIKVRKVWKDLLLAERSVLPKGRAATQFSLIQAQSGGGKNMDTEHEKALRELLGNDLAAQVIAKVDGTNVKAEAADAVVKEGPTPVEPVVPKEPEPEVQATSTVGEVSMTEAVAALLSPVQKADPPAPVPAGKCVCPDCGKEVSQGKAESCSLLKCSACKVAMKPVKAAKKDDGDDDIRLLIKDLATSMVHLTAEVAAIRAGEAPRVATMQPPTAPVASDSLVPPVEETPRVVKEMAKNLFRMPAQ